MIAKIINTFWIVLQARHPHMFEVRSEWGLLQQKSVLALQQILASTIRYMHSVEYANSSEAITLDDDLIPFFEQFIDRPSSLLESGERADTFWCKRGGHTDFEHGYKGITNLAECVWTTMRPMHVGREKWADILMKGR
jgi:hypothetical protein